MDFKIIEGGADSLRYKYISGEITDTRLMGVLGLHLHWRDENAQDDSYDKHQFFYYDIEELGLDQLAVYVGNDALATELASRTLFGGLGGKMIPVCEREARWLVHRFVEGTLLKGEALPAATGELSFILDASAPFSEGEEFILNKKMCAPRETGYATCHYFLMRLFGHDQGGARLLASSSLKPADYSEIPLRNPATFLNNKITRAGIKDGMEIFLCESLVEGQDSHYMEFSELGIKGGVVAHSRLRTRFRVSDIEASMRLGRHEYVSVYEITGPEAEFDMSFAGFSIGCTSSQHESGTMYLRFFPDNSHVEKPQFNLSDDIQAIYFVSDFGQLVVAAYSEEASLRADEAIGASGIADMVAITNKYRFHDSVMYDFAQSGFEDFGEFVETIQE